MAKKALSLAVIAVALGLVAAGCGASAAQKQTDAWATAVCSSVSAWRYEVHAVASDFASGISRDSFRTKIAQLTAATSDMTRAVKAATLPDTADGRAALAGVRGLVDGWAGQIAATRAKGQRMLASKDRTVVQTGLQSLTLVLRSLDLGTAAEVDGVRAGLSGAPAKALQKSKDCAELATVLS